MDSEEKQRAEAFKSRIDALNAIGKRWETQGAGAVARVEEEKRETRLQATIEFKMKEEAEKEKQKREKLHQMSLKTAEQNKLIIRAKR